MTVSDALERSNGRPSGFDYLRLALALAVVLTHVVNLSFGQRISNMLVQSPLRPVQTFILPMFFALSGFLVAGSLRRSRTLFSFFGLRALRLMPALAVESLLAAVLIGACFTTLGVSDYFADPLFRNYLWNMIGDPHYQLPGVFASNPQQTVNGQLWTEPWEMASYVVIGVLGLVGLVRDRLAFLRCTMVLTIAIAFLAYTGFITIHEYMAPWTLMESFLFGSSAYFFADVVQLRRGMLLAAIAASIALLISPVGDFLVAIPLTYITVYLGVLDPPRIGILNSGDYSYGIYLYGYPIQQAVIAVMGPQPWLLSLALAIPIILLAAFLSWHCVERPACRLRAFLWTAESKWLAARARDAAPREITA